MGMRTCRFWSVLVLAGVAMIGCNNTPDKPKLIGKGPLINNPNGNVGQQWQNQPNNQQAFPQAKQPNTPAGGLQPFDRNSPLPGPGAGGLPGYSSELPSVPTLPKMPMGGDSRLTVPTAPDSFASDPRRIDPIPMPQPPSTFPIK